MSPHLRLAAAMLAIALICGTLLPACASRESPPQSSRPTEWNVVVAEQTGGADPLSEYGTNSQYQLIPKVIEPLLHIEMLPDGSAWGVVNDLAEKWSFPDPTTLVVELKRGVLFQNGEELTAEHVKSAYDGIVNASKPGRRAVTLKVLGDAEIVDKYTIRWRMPAPNLGVLGSLWNLNIPSLGRVNMSAEEFEARPIGTGPYKYVSYQRGGNFVFTRNDDYWGGKADIKEVVFRKVTEDAARLAALESGQADVINNVPVHEVARLQRHPRVNVERIEGLRMFFLAFNVGHKPFDNKLVRQAVNYSVDGPAIIKNIFDGIGYSINGPVGSNVVGADPKLKRYPYDPQKAKELLAQAGYPNGCDVQLYYSAGRYPKDTEVCQVVAAQMVKGGFRVELISQEWAIFWETTGVNGGKLPFYYIGRGSLTDADTLYDQYFRTGTTKRSNFSNPEIDKLVEAQQKTPDMKKRTAILQQAGKIIMEEAPFVPLYNLADIYGVAKNVNWKLRPDEKVLASDMKIH